MEHLRQIRQAKDYTQAQLARKARVSQQTVSILELGGIQYPRWDTVLRLALALRCDPASLYPVGPAATESAVDHAAA